jgi:hypothetical protein
MGLAFGRETAYNLPSSFILDLGAAGATNGVDPVGVGLEPLGRTWHILDGRAAVGVPAATIYCSL